MIFGFYGCGHPAIKIHQCSRALVEASESEEEECSPFLEKRRVWNLSMVATKIEIRCIMLHPKCDGNTVGMGQRNPINIGKTPKGWLKPCKQWDKPQTIGVRFLPQYVSCLSSRDLLYTTVTYCHAVLHMRLETAGPKVTIQSLSITDYAGSLSTEPRRETNIISNGKPWNDHLQLRNTTMQPSIAVWTTTNACESGAVCIHVLVHQCAGASIDISTHRSWYCQIYRNSLAVIDDWWLLMIIDDYWWLFNDYWWLLMIIDDY